MNDQTAKLIESLAAKLGTTAEYLWGVLVRQAYVSATFSLFVISISVVWIVIYAAGMYRAVKNDAFSYENETPGTIIFSVAGGIGTVMALMAIGFGAKEAVTGFLNPEYWALQEILRQI